MKWQIAALVMLLIPTTTRIAASQTLSSLVDRNRVLIVFASSSADPQFQQQLTLLAEHADSMKERDLVMVPNLFHAAATASQQPLAANSVEDQNAARTRKRFHITPGEFTVILLGKDGGEKVRKYKPVTIEQLNEIIDAMPMRKDEMRLRTKHP
jgi:hypothetical protein